MNDCADLQIRRRRSIDSEWDDIEMDGNCYADCFMGFLKIRRLSVSCPLPAYQVWQAERTVCAYLDGIYI